MPIALDHLLVPSRDRDAGARLLARILGLQSEPARVGPFAAVHVNDGLTLDFDTWEGEVPKGHFCFRVDDATFDDVLQRLRQEGIAWRSQPRGPDDRQVNTSLGGRILYWAEPDGHVWELLTQSYAR